MGNPERIDATPDGVSVEEQFATLTSPTSPRMQALAAIEEKNRERLEAETGVKFDSGTPANHEPDPSPAPEPAPEPSFEDQIKKQMAEPQPVPDPVAAPKYKVKIDGAEQEVSQEELIRTYQKNAAADRRLEEAARLLREAEETVAKAKSAAQQTPEAQPAPAKTPDELRQEAAVVLDRLMDGDQDAATEALANLIVKAKGGDQPTQTPAQPAVDPNVLADQVLELMAVTSAVERAKADYPDIFADPDLDLLAGMKVEKLVGQGIPRHQAILDAADQVYQSIGKDPKGRQTEPAEKTKSQRQENKERLDPVPTASAAAITPQSPEASNPSSVIAELASRRLGQSLPRQTG